DPQDGPSRSGGTGVGAMDTVPVKPASVRQRRTGEHECQRRDDSGDCCYTDDSRSPIGPLPWMEVERRHLIPPFSPAVASRPWAGSCPQPPVDNKLTVSRERPFCKGVAT